MRPAFKTIAVAFLVCGFTIALASPTPEEQLEKEFTGRDIVCGYDVNYPTTISSPNYPGPYDSYSGLCRWKITTPDDSVQLIQITVRVLDTPAPSWGGCVANLDDILVFRGMPGLESHTMSARFCGSSHPAHPIYHLGSTVYVLFVMNSMDPNYSGFTLDVEFHSGTIPTAECPADWVENGASCYQLSTTTVSWTVAKLNCEAKGGHLLTLDTWEEQLYMEDTYVMTYVRPMISAAQLWIGGEYSDGAWRWLTSGDMIDPSWPSWGYRGNNSTLLGICLAYSVADGFYCQMYDYICNYARPYICEINLP